MKRIAAVGAMCAALCALSFSPASAVVMGKPVHAIALYGEPKYGPDFKNFDYVNPNAPKGGQIVFSNQNDQTFDTFNPFSLKGAPAEGIGLMYEYLMVASGDEPFTHYCFLCQTVEVAPDNSWVEYKMRPEAKFSDGSPVTADDVAFSYTSLIEKGRPQYRFYYEDVAKVEVRDPKTVRFTFKVKTNKELPLILGQLPVLSKAYWSKRDFTATSLDIPVTSGPYTVDTFEVGRNVVYKRNPNYWGKNIALNRGQWNFDRVRYEYFRDPTAQFEAFKANTYDLRGENISRQWATAYDFPAIKDGRVMKIEVPDFTPMPTQSWVLNLRKPIFQDRRVREALNLAFDFEALNKTIFYNSYTRLRSYWQRSDLEAKGPPSAAERALLEPLKDKIPPETLTQEFQQPTTDGSGTPRANLLKARDLLTQAGWTLKDGVLTKDGKPFTFEMLEVQAGLEAVITPWIQNLQRLGIKATMRVIDSSQYVNRLNDFDFDVTNLYLFNSLSPGNEQREYWGSEAASRPGSTNYSGVKDPAVDALIQKILDAQDRDSLLAASHALDRVLTWNYYRVMHYGPLTDRFAYWTKLKHPDKFPLAGIGQTGDAALQMWWLGPAAAK